MRQEAAGNGSEGSERVPFQGRKASQCDSNRPLLPTAPAWLDRYSLHSLRRQSGRSLGGGGRVDLAAGVASEDGAGSSMAQSRRCGKSCAASRVRAECCEPRARFVSWRPRGSQRATLRITRRITALRLLRATQRDASRDRQQRRGKWRADCCARAARPRRLGRIDAQARRDKAAHNRATPEARLHVQWTASRPLLPADSRLC